MALSTAEVERIYMYNGVRLRALPGDTPEDVRTVNAAIYGELGDCEIHYGKLENGKQIITFERQAVGTKGAGHTLGQFAEFMRAHASGNVPPTADDLLVRALEAAPARRTSEALAQFASQTEDGHPAPAHLLAPLA